MQKWLLLTLFTMLSSIGFSQSISGTITDEENNFLPAVNIAILHTSNGVISSDNGQYNLEIPANKSVVITYSFIGYEIEKNLANLGHIGMHAAHIFFNLKIENIIVFLHQRGHG